MSDYPPELGPADWEEAALVQRLQAHGVSEKTDLVALATKLMTLAELLGERPAEWCGDGTDRLFYAVRVLDLNATAEALVARILSPKPETEEQAEERRVELAVSAALGRAIALATTAAFFGLAAGLAGALPDQVQAWVSDPAFLALDPEQRRAAIQDWLRAHVEAASRG